MPINRCRLVPVSALMLGLCAGGAQGQTFYTTEASWLAAITGPSYLEDFSGFTFGNPLNGSQVSYVAPGGSGFGWTANTPAGLWSNVSALSTFSNNQTIVITFTGNPVTAFGGLFTNTDVNGLTIPGTVTVLLSNGQLTSVTNPSAFVGWTGSAPIASITFVSESGVSGNFVQLDHFRVGTAFVNTCLAALTGCVADVSLPQDGNVNVNDLLYIIGNFGQVGSASPARGLRSIDRWRLRRERQRSAEGHRVVGRLRSQRRLRRGHGHVLGHHTGGLQRMANSRGWAAGGNCTDTDGDRIPNVFELNNCLAYTNGYVGTNLNDDDTDDDNIKDGDEVYGTIGGLNLPAMGANALRKNVFLEADWLTDSEGGVSHNHRPQASAVAAMMAAFASCPITNPCGPNGVSLIVDFGQGGPFTGGNNMGTDSIVVYDAELNAYKAANFAANRNGYFFYSIHCHFINSTVSGILGIAELPGDDLLVGVGGSYANADFVAHVWMHEYGHNLNLHHGGFEDLNFKPNYKSIMNYRYTATGVDTDCNGVGNGPLDYSRGLNAALNENLLSEAAGICGGVPIDWNGNAVIDGGLVAANINCNPGFRTTCGIADPTNCYDSVCGVLNDFNDWAAVIFTGLNEADFAPPTIIYCDPPLPPTIRRPGR